MSELEHDASQESAIDLICNARLGIVTGGPGTGKTTCLRTALDRLGPGLRVELAAPTGKAAKRMHQATGRAARTIHRLLGWRGDGFAFTAHSPLECDLVVVDESSMIDVELGAALFDAIGPRTRLIMVGDVDQLPSVGPGRVFGDLIEWGKIPVVRLTTLHRSARDAWVSRNAPRILNGGPIDLDDAPDFRFVRVQAPVDIGPALCTLAEANINVQCLIPQRTGVAGIDLVNTALQAVRNTVPFEHGDPSIQRERYTLRDGDTVIQTKNDYKLAVFNGEIGSIVGMRAGVTTVSYPDFNAEGSACTREVAYSHEQANALQLAYALTIHRGQGSEYPCIAVVVHSTHTRMLNRKLFYTAITRTRGACTIVGDDQGIKTALGTGYAGKRNTTLIERLEGSIDDVIIDAP